LIEIEDNDNKFSDPSALLPPTSAINLERTDNSSLSKLDKSELLILEELNQNTKRTTTEENNINMEDASEKKASSVQDHSIIASSVKERSLNNT